MKQIDWDSGKLPAGAVAGGYRAVKTRAELDAIPVENKTEGMLVCCLDEQAIYILLADGKFENVATYSDVTDDEVRAIFDNSNNGKNTKEGGAAS